MVVLLLSEEWTMYAVWRIMPKALLVPENSAVNLAAKKWL